MWKILERHASFNLQRFRRDNGTGEYDNQIFRKTFTENGITLETSPHTQNMHRVERMIQTLTAELDQL